MAQLPLTTEQTVTCVSTSIDTVGVNLVDLVKGTPVILPAGCAITEVEVQRRNATLLAPDLQQNIIVGYLGTSEAVFSVSSLNTMNWMGYSFPQRIGANVNTNLRIKSSYANITAGSVYVVFKYKPIATGERKY